MNQEQINQLINANTVVIFGKGEKHDPRCGFTANVQSIFGELSPDYQMINILRDSELRKSMKTFSDWPTFPQIYVQGEFVGGGDIVQEMYQEGELASLIKPSK